MLSKAIYLKAARIIALFALDRAKNPRGDSFPKGDKYSKSDIVNPPLYVTRRHPTFHRIVQPSCLLEYNAELIHLMAQWNSTDYSHSLLM